MAFFSLYHIAPAISRTIDKSQGVDYNIRKEDESINVYGRSRYTNITIELTDGKKLKSDGGAWGTNGPLFEALGIDDLSELGALLVGKTVRFMYMDKINWVFAMDVEGRHLDITKEAKADLHIMRMVGAFIFPLIILSICGVCQYHLIKKWKRQYQRGEKKEKRTYRLALKGK